MYHFTTQIDFGLLGEQQVEVHYKHHRGFRGSQYEPAENEWCELLRVAFLGRCVMSLLCDDALDALKDAALEDWRGENPELLMRKVA
jgi:hypothetical protein